MAPLQKPPTAPTLTALQAPSIDRRITMQPLHLALVVVLLLIVTLAALGFFGQTRGTVTQRNETLAILVDYPTRFRYK